MKIGSLKLENKIVLAPMAGVTDLPYRIICKEMGVGLVISEMVSAKGLYYEDPGTHRLTKIEERERPVGLQIFGSDPHIIGQVIRKHLNPRPDIDLIDINMGCPAPKIVKNGDGSALMQNPNLIREILKEAVRQSQKPVSLKIRMGWDHNSLNGIEIAKMAEEEGIDAITIHGRTREMFYSGQADWDYIRRLKESVSIPVIGNGDIFSPQDGLDMLKETGVDAIAIGRGAMGNPWIFKRINNLLKGQEDQAPSPEEVIDTAKRHLQLACQIKGEDLAVKEMRKHMGWYLKGLKQAKEMRAKINRLSSKEQIKQCLDDYLLRIG